MLKKIIFMGTPFFAVPILKSLYQNGYPVSVVYTQPPQKSQRGQKINKSPIQGISETLKIEHRTPSSLKNNKVEYEYLRELNADIAIVVAYGQIIPKEYLSLVKKGFINIHASLLPKWRGAAPIQRSIMNLEKKTGVSIMKIREKLDTGPVCNSYKINIEADDNSETMTEKLSTLAAEKILDNIDEILEDKIEFKEQNHNEATYATKIEKKEGQIDWTKNAESIIGKINGLYPNPGAFFIYNGERYKILRASLTESSGKIGEVLDNYLEVSCGNEKSIRILEIQRQGKRTQNISEFMLGSQIKKGSNLNNA
ncbi:methionyl-tRNA formyltransferase [Candidatus Pelagibacter ubique]|uniref:Methionyl-tRNA formyltransferase n=1 Tax=Pelagibacter ubique TaxID=198252 RepID=A0ABX1T0Q9_PELUQ|nr:methionyl-tRNA formyltransferase [Candidatus Pelagibacter ubique]NMN67171.1 methionyl-tRNA formyltransferase [Candidatus Pelagibacter ubique]